LSHTVLSQTCLAWLPKQFQNGSLQSQSFKTNFFRIAGTSRAKTSVGGNAECLLAIGEFKDNRLSGMTLSFNGHLLRVAVTHFSNKLH